MPGIDDHTQKQSGTLLSDLSVTGKETWAPIDKDQVPNIGHKFSTDGAQVPTDGAECQTKDRKLNTDGAEVRNLGTLPSQPVRGEQSSVITEITDQKPKPEPEPN